jgi:antitoxin component YwqK of YwqJK toxin-antitoxin module
LIYEKGGFFISHRDGEKLDRMVATLVVSLPSVYEGGELIVSYDGKQHEIIFKGAKSGYKLITRQNSDGTWEGVLGGDSQTYFDTGELKRVIPYSAIQNLSGEKEGEWSGIQEGEEKGYYQSGEVASITTYVRKEQSNDATGFYSEFNGTWIGVREGGKSGYYESGAISNEIDVVTRQVVTGQAKGLWQGNLETSLKYYYENGNLRSEKTNVVVEGDDAVAGWYKTRQEGLFAEYHENGLVHHTILVENGIFIEECWYTYDANNNPTENCE